MKIPGDELVHFVQYQETDFPSRETTGGCEESVKLLRRTAQDVRHALLQETKFLYHISSSANTKGGANTNGTTEVSNHALRLSRLVNGRGDNNHDRPTV